MALSDRMEAIPRCIALAVVAQSFDDYRRNYVRRLDRLRKGKDPTAAEAVMAEVEEFVASPRFKSWCEAAGINRGMAQRAFGDRKREWAAKYLRPGDEELPCES